MRLFNLRYKCKSAGHDLSYLGLWLFREMKSAVILICACLGFVASETPSCEEKNKCLDVLKRFTHVEEFQIYESNKELKEICSDANEAYDCLFSGDYSICELETENVKLNMILSASSALLRNFCTKRNRKQTYLNNINCYKNAAKDLNDCSDKYRKSLEWIRTDLNNFTQQMQENFCSMKWFENCVYDVIGGKCRRRAAQAMKTYVTNAWKLPLELIEKKEDCTDDLFGFEELPTEVCQPDNFQKCLAYLPFMKEEANNSQKLPITEDYFVTTCQELIQSMECLDETLGKCLHNSLLLRQTMVRREDSVCRTNASLLEDYKSEKRCIERNRNHLKKCMRVFEHPSQYRKYTLLPSSYQQNFCLLVNQMVTCLQQTVRIDCGIKAEDAIRNVLKMSLGDVLNRCPTEKTTDLNNDDIWEE